MKKALFAAFLMLPLIYTTAQVKIDTWSHEIIDSTRTTWGGEDFRFHWIRPFGIDHSDLNKDGYQDVVSGWYAYLNPGNDVNKSWQRIFLGIKADAVLVTDIDGDEYVDIIAQALPAVYWIEADNISGTSWKAKQVGDLPRTGHFNGQGYAKANISGDEQEEILLAVHGGIYAVELPMNPETEDWTWHKIAETDSDEGFALADFDGDGDNDLVCGDKGTKPTENGKSFHYTEVKLFTNPGSLDKSWSSTKVGEVIFSVDRVSAGDIDGDGKPDIAISEERYPGKEPDSHLFWFKNTGAENWERNLVVTQYSMNNLDLADMDADGDLDIVTNEHKGPNLSTQIWMNNGKGVFKKQHVFSGAEMHLGAKAVDIDADGDLDIIGQAWDNFKYLHVFVNSSKKK